MNTIEMIGIAVYGFIAGMVQRVKGMFGGNTQSNAPGNSERGSKESGGPENTRGEE